MEEQAVTDYNLAFAAEHSVQKRIGPMFTMNKSKTVAVAVLFLAAGTLTFADTEEPPKEEARSEDLRVEAGEAMVEPNTGSEALAFVQATTMPEDDEWHFIAAPYLWVVDTSGTIKIGPSFKNF